MRVEWYEFNKFEAVDEKYLPARGEGDTIATQITTAVSKLVYKWYNDGDVFDNTYKLGGWCNDLSSYANWLYKNVEETRPILERIRKIKNEGEYEDMLLDLCNTVQTLEFLADKETEKVGSVYECDGPFEFREFGDYDEDYEDDGWF